MTDNASIMDEDLHYVNEFIESTLSSRTNGKPIYREYKATSEDYNDDRDEKEQIYDEFTCERLYVNESVLENSLGGSLESKTIDKSLQKEHVAANEGVKDDNEEDEGLYDEYMYDRDYEGYKFSFQELSRKKKTANVRTAKLLDKSVLQKILIFTLSWLLCMLLVLFIDRAVWPI